MREWLESLSAEARETLGGELLEALQRRGVFSRSVAAEADMPNGMRRGLLSAETAEIGLHNIKWPERGTMGTAAAERAFPEVFASGAEPLRFRREESVVGEDLLETFSRRLEREDRRYDGGFPANI